MKKLLIASTALVATAGMASADITITGHAAAGIYSGLSYTKAVTGLVPTTDTTYAASTLNSTTGALTAGSVTAAVMPTTAHASDDSEKKAARQAVRDAKEALAQAVELAAASPRPVIS